MASWSMNAGIMNSDPQYWKYGAGVLMSNGVAIELAEKWCVRQIEELKSDGAGKWGPVTNFAIQRIM